MPPERSRGNGRPARHPAMGWTADALHWFSLVPQPRLLAMEEVRPEDPSSGGTEHPPKRPGFDADHAGRSRKPALSPLHSSGQYDSAIRSSSTIGSLSGARVTRPHSPLRLAGSEMRVLVNRGWVPAGADHRQVPLADIPVGPVESRGSPSFPATVSSPWPLKRTQPGEAVWQNPDLDRFRRGVPYPLQPIILQLDLPLPAASSGTWPRPDEAADKHLSYALQWFGFAATTVGIWVWFLLRRP